MESAALTRVMGCPTCGTAFTDWAYDHTRPDPIEYDGGRLSPVLAGRTVIDHPTAALLAWVLTPCGCRVSPDEWALCQTACSAWFARPDEAEAAILAAMAKEAVR